MPSTTLYSEGLASRTSERSTLPFDIRTLMVTVALVGIGLISIYSATYDSPSSSFFTSQLIFAAAGLAGMIVIAFLPREVIQVSSVPMYLLGLLGLILVLVIGQTINGQKNWINLGFFSLQPSEIAKIGTLLMAAQFVSREGRDLRTLRDLFTLCGIVLLPIALITLEKDTGSMLVYSAMLLGIAFWAGADLFLVFCFVAPIVVGGAALFVPLYGYLPVGIALAIVLGVMFLFRRRLLATAFGIIPSIVAGFGTQFVVQHLPSHMQQRINVFLNPSMDPRGTGYHVMQSLMAVGSGGWTGKGFLNGTLTHLGYIPEQWTDFIYSVPTEEFGFVGGVIVLLLMMTLIWFALDTARSLRSKFESTVCFGIAMILFYHTTINIGMAIGVVPVMGIPLPFLSKGGSSLLLNMMMVGLLLNFYRFRSDLRRV